MNRFSCWSCWIHNKDEHFSIGKERISLFFFVKKVYCCSGYAGYLPSYYPPPPVFNTGRVILHPGANKLQEAHFFDVVIFGSIPPSMTALSLPLSRSLSSLCVHQVKGEGGLKKNDTAKRAGLFLFIHVAHSCTNQSYLLLLWKNSSKSALRQMWNEF